MSILKVNAINDANGGSNAILYGVAAPTNSMGFRNRIINGAMVIDQRNNGAAVLNASGYIVDRWGDSKAGSGQYTAQRSTTAPSNFTNSLQHTVTTAVSPDAGDIYQVFQMIEGFNTADLAFGTAAAQAVTISFWVRSSVTGLYGMRLQNSNASRTYVATYTVITANTWEYKTITIPGDTTGTWSTDNGIGIGLIFDLGSGSNQNGTAGVWASADARRTSGCVNWISNSGATFYITGVQLEAGSVASPFERRDYGRELIMCERYYQALTDNMRISAMAFNSTVLPATWVFKTTMRATPTTTATVGTSTILVGGTNLVVTSIGGGVSSVYGYSMDVSVASGATPGFGAELRIVGGRVAASAEL